MPEWAPTGLGRGLRCRGRGAPLLLAPPEGLGQGQGLGLGQGLGRRRSLQRPCLPLCLRLAVRAQQLLPQRPAGTGPSLAGLLTAPPPPPPLQEGGAWLRWQPGAGAAAAQAALALQALRCPPEGLAPLLLLLLPVAALLPGRAGCAGLRAWQSRAMLW